MQLLLLKVRETLLLRLVRKACSILWSASVVFVFLEKGRPKNTVYRFRFSFPYVDI